MHNMTCVFIYFQSKKEDIGLHPSLITDFYCLHLSSATTIQRADLEKVGIKSLWDIGTRLVDIFEKKIKQSSVAAELKTFLQARRQEVEC